VPSGLDAGPRGGVAGPGTGGLGGGPSGAVPPAAGPSGAVSPAAGSHVELGVGLSMVKELGRTLGSEPGLSTEPMLSKAPGLALKYTSKR